MPPITNTANIMFLRISRSSAQLSYNSRKSLRLLNSASKGFVTDNAETATDQVSHFTYKRFNATDAHGNQTRTSATPNISSNADVKLKNFRDSSSGFGKSVNSDADYQSRFPRKRSDDDVPPDSIWYTRLCAFDDCVLQSLSTSKQNEFNLRSPTNYNGGRGRNGNQQKNSGLMFWDSINRAMRLYHDLRDCPQLTPARVSSLINLLHNGLRINRGQMVQLKKKPDADSKSFNIEMTNFITDSLNEITKDVLDENIAVNEYGLMHLLTSFKELGKQTEAVDAWKTGMKNPKLIEDFVHPKVVGVMLPVLFEKGAFSFEQCRDLYETSRKRLRFAHPNLTCGFIHVCLLANENMIALETFSKMCESLAPAHFNYLIEAHLSFLGLCKDINIAKSFFNKAIVGEMPYKVHLHVSQVNTLLSNIWTETNDFAQVNDTWKTALKYYCTDPAYKKRNITGILSSLNNAYFGLFFEKYADDKVKGFEMLQQSMNTFMELNGSLDEPCLNIILTKCTVWQSQEVIDSVLKYFDSFNIPQTIITKRILLKSLGSLDNITCNDILRRWNELIRKEDQMGQRYIANADWAALRDATISWAQIHADEAGCEQRVHLYFQLLSLYKKYARDVSQVNSFSVRLSPHLAVAKAYLEANPLDSISTDDISIINDLHSLEVNEAFK